MMPVLDRAQATLVRRLRWPSTEDGRESLVSKEWLVTNGLGGCASGTIAGALTRRYHALLIAALPTPFGRTVMFNHLAETIRWPDGRVAATHTVRETPEGREVSCAAHLRSFVLEKGLPVWTNEIDGGVIEKRILMPRLQNTTHITYRLLSPGSIRLELRPFVAFRLHEAPVSQPAPAPYLVQTLGERCEISPGGDLQPLPLFVYGRDKAFTLLPEPMGRSAYRLEQRRGYDASGDLWSPGYLRLTLCAMASFRTCFQRAPRTGCITPPMRHSGSAMRCTGISAPPGTDRRSGRFSRH